VNYQLSVIVIKILGIERSYFL